jgi:diamine N-acetyltransferase
MAERIVARGKKTVIRWFQREDVDKRQAWPRHTDPLYSHNDPRPMSVREQDFWFLERSSSTTYKMFAIDDFHGNMVGWLTLRNIHPQASTSVLGIALNPLWMDIGYGTDSLMAFLKYYFDSMGFRDMQLDVAAFNRRGMRSYEKCGFRYVGQHWTEHPSSLFPPVFKDSRYRDVVRYFKRSLLGVEVLYYDMAIDRATFMRHKAIVEATEQEAALRQEEGVPARRTARR